MWWTSAELDGSKCIKEERKACANQLPADLVICSSKQTLLQAEELPKTTPYPTFAKFATPATALLARKSKYERTRVQHQKAQFPLRGWKTSIGRSTQWAAATRCQSMQAACPFAMVAEVAQLTNSSSQEHKGDYRAQHRSGHGINVD